MNPNTPYYRNLRRDKNTSNGDFIVFGIRRSVRPEIRVKDEKLQVLTLELSAWNTDTQLVSIEM